MAELEAINRKLERKQRKLEAIFDGISDVMAIISTNFTIISVNRLFFNSFGPNQPKGHFCYKVFKKEILPAQTVPSSYPGKPTVSAEKHWTLILKISAITLKSPYRHYGIPETVPSCFFCCYGMSPKQQSTKQSITTLKKWPLSGLWLPGWPMRSTIP